MAAAGRSIPDLLTAARGAVKTAGLTAAEKAILQKAITKLGKGVKGASTPPEGIARILDDIIANPKSVIQLMEENVNLVDDITKAAKNAPLGNPTKGMTFAQKAAYYTTEAAKYGITPTNTLKFMTFATLMGLLGAFLDGTDDVEANITKIEIYNDNKNYIRVTYDRPSVFFHPGINDTFKFIKDTPTNPQLNGVTATIVARDTDTSAILDYKINSVETNPTSWGRIKCSSSFGNQLGTTIRDSLDWLKDNVIDPVLNTGKDAFCSLIPFLCNPTFLWVVGGICGLFSCIICIYAIWSSSKK